MASSPYGCHVSLGVSEGYLRDGTGYREVYLRDVLSLNCLAGEAWRSAQYVVTSEEAKVYGSHRDGSTLETAP